MISSEGIIYYDVHSHSFFHKTNLSLVLPNQSNKGRVIQSTKAGDVYTQLLNKIREIKSLQSSTNPLVISMERCVIDGYFVCYSCHLLANLIYAMPFYLGTCGIAVYTLGHDS